MRNYGQHNALLVRHPRRAVRDVVTIDDDLQHPPEEIAKLLEQARRGLRRRLRHARSANSTGSCATWPRGSRSWRCRAAMGAQTARNVSAFRAFRTRPARAFAAYGGPYVSIDVLLTWGTDAVRARRGPPRPAAGGGVQLHLPACSSTHALNMMTGFSTLPLQIASLIGFVFTLFGFAVLVLVARHYVVDGGSVPGFPFLASIIAIFCGAQLFALGIIGEYLARIIPHHGPAPVCRARRRRSARARRVRGALGLDPQQLLVGGQREELDELVGESRPARTAARDARAGPRARTTRRRRSPRGSSRAPRPRSGARARGDRLARSSSVAPWRSHCQTCEREISAVAASSISP